MVFNKGDRVRCVSPRDELTVGKEYTVTEDSTANLTRVINDDGCNKGYYNDRFELVTSRQEDDYLVGVEVPAQDLGDFISRAVDAGYGINFVTKGG